MEVLLEVFWQQIATSIGVPLDGISFIYDAFEHAQQRTPNESGEGEHVLHHITAAELCNSFVRLAQDTFGKESASALNSWNLASSEQLGRAIYALINCKVFQQQESDLPSDFDGRFDFSVDTPPLQRYQYTLQPLEKLPYQLQMPPLSIVPDQYFDWITWSIAIVATIVIGQFVELSAVPVVVCAVVFAIAFIRWKVKYPYRFSVRALLILMTVVAIGLGLFTCMTR